MVKKKAYEGHEIAYRRMKAAGIATWGERKEGGDARRRKAIDADSRRFLLEVLAQPWSPRAGRVIELGCGTGPMLRWFCAKGYRGLGVDVSRTAIAMARAQSRGLPVRFERADLCGPLPERRGSFDVALDGHCLHCIISRRDRAAFLRNARRLLRPGGLLVVMTMCAPVHREAFARLLPGQYLRSDTLYVATAKASQYEGSRVIRNRLCMPTRHIGHWRRVLAELAQAGFRTQLFRYKTPTADDPFGDLSVAALA